MQPKQINKFLKKGIEVSGLKIKELVFVVVVVFLSTFKFHINLAYETESETFDFIVGSPTIHACLVPPQVVSEAPKATRPGETPQSQTNQEGWSS